MREHIAHLEQDLKYHALTAITPLGLVKNNVILVLLAMIALMKEEKLVAHHIISALQAADIKD